MQNQAFEAKRTQDGAIEIRHYARAAAAERRETRTAAVQAIGNGAKRVVLAAVALVGFWNIPPMGGTGSKDLPYR